MAYNFPLALSEFFDDAPITAATFDLAESMEYNETAGGEIITAELGNRLWKADIEIVSDKYHIIERVRAKLDVLRYPGRSLFVHSLPIWAPQYDPTGAILGSTMTFNGEGMVFNSDEMEFGLGGAGSAVTLSGVASNNRDIQLSGLPSGYQLTPGDFLSFTYGSNPTRYALHRIVDGGTADGDGDLIIEVAPFIRVGFSLGTAVRLIKPVMKAVIVPGSVRAPKSSGLFSTGLSFSLTQTLR